MGRSYLYTNPHKNLFCLKSKEWTKQWRKQRHSTALLSRIKHGRRRKELVRWLWSPYSFSDLRRSTLDRWAGVMPLLPVVVVVRTVPLCRTTPSSRWNQLPIVVIIVAEIICVAAKHPRTKLGSIVIIVSDAFIKFVYFSLWGKIETPIM